MLGGDSCVSSGDSRELTSDSKVFRRGSVLFGFAGSFRGGDLLRYLADPPEPNGDPAKWARVDLVPYLRRAAKEHEVEWSECEAIAATRGRLFYIGGSWSVIEPAPQLSDNRRTERWLAIGNGAPWAQGCLHALKDSGLTLNQLATEALEASEAWCSAVRRPFRFLEI